MILLGLAAHGAPFVYPEETEPQLLLGMRKTGGASELVVNLGAVSRFTSLTAGTTIEIDQYNTNQLAAAFSGLDELGWSVFGYQAFSTTNGAPKYTLWMSRARTDLETPSVPWNRASAPQQSNPGNKVRDIGLGAVLYSGQNSPDPVKNTETAVIMPVDTSRSYGVNIGANGDFASTFKGSIENQTTPDFVSSSMAVRSDLYEIQPTSPPSPTKPSTFLGYFEFTFSGRMTFTAAGGAPPLPTLTIDDLSLLKTTAGPTQAVFNVTLSQVSKTNATVLFATLDGTAKAGTDYVAQSGTLTFSAGETNQTIAIALADNPEFKPEAVFFVTLNNPVNATVAKAQGQATIRNPAPPTRPLLTLNRTQDTADITFPTEAGVKYSLRITNSAGLTTPLSQWPKYETVITGDGNAGRFSDPSSGAERFYSVEAIR